MKRRNPLRRWGGRIGAFGVAALVALAIGYGFVPKPQVVDVARVTRGRLLRTLDADGKVRVRDRFVVAAPVAGVMSRIDLDPGDAVTTDAVLSTIRPTRSALLDPQSRAAAKASLDSALDAQRQATASIERIDALLDVARENRARFERLFAAGGVTRQQLDEARAEARAREADDASARAAAQVAGHQVESAKAVLGVLRGEGGESVPVTSPIDGAVLRVLQESEAPVAPGTPLVEVGDLRAVEIVADVLTQDAAPLVPGTRALVDGFGTNRASLTATVRRVDPSAFTEVSALGVKEQRVNVVLDLDPLDAHDGHDTKSVRLGDGFFVNVHFILYDAPNVLRIPQSALFRRGDGHAAYVVKKNRAQLVAVTVGEASANDAEVLAGVSDGDLVVVHPSDAVRAGKEVRAREQ